MWQLGQTWHPRGRSANPYPLTTSAHPPVCTRGPVCGAGPPARFCPSRHLLCAAANQSAGLSSRAHVFFEGKEYPRTLDQSRRNPICYYGDRSCDFGNSWEAAAPDGSGCPSPTLQAPPAALLGGAPPQLFLLWPLDLVPLVAQGRVLPAQGPNGQPREPAPPPLTLASPCPGLACDVCLVRGPGCAW